MPLCLGSTRLERSRARYTAVVAVPAFDAEQTIEATLASIENSVRFHRRRNSSDTIALSIVDDASRDSTPDLVAAFARDSTLDVYLQVHERNQGRATARNRALSAVDAELYLFLDHDDTYLEEHITCCLQALAEHPEIDFVKTAVVLSDPVHSDWESRIAASLTQNLCVRERVHRLIGGFHEETEVELYGCDDVLYNRTLQTLFRGLELPCQTVRFERRPGNSFDRQYEKKLRRPAELAEVTLSSAQLEVEPRVLELQARRVEEVRSRLAVARRRRALEDSGPPQVAASLGRELRPQVYPRFGDGGERIYAMMVTGKSSERAALAQASLKSFVLQRYPNRALVLVNDGDFDLDLSELPSDRVTSIRPTGRRTLGELRNLGLEAVPEDALWTYWDDDDWRHPRLLEVQRQVLAKLEVQACLLTQQIKYDLRNDVAYVDSHPGGFAGTLLAFKHANWRFPHDAAGEDSAYCDQLKREWRWFPWVNPPHFMIRFFHGANTWDAEHFGLNDRVPGNWDLQPKGVRYLRSVLPEYELTKPGLAATTPGREP